MDLTWIIVSLGIIITLVTLTDVLLTVLHVDTDGPIASNIFHFIWLITMATARLFPSRRRYFIALAGPVMILSVFILWMLFYILGFAFIYWPFIDLFQTDEEIFVHGFFEAFYYSGVTATVLGFGDISPINNLLRLASVIQSAFGFALLTGIVTYLINVVSGITDRNTLAIRLWAETNHTGDGKLAVIRSLVHEEEEDLPLRMQMLIQSMFMVHQKMHQYPILDIYYRSKETRYSPEIMIKSAAEISVTIRLATADKKYLRLRSISSELGKAATELMKLIIVQYTSSDVQNRFNTPQPDQNDIQRLWQIRNLMDDALPGLQLKNAEEDKELLNLICRLHIFLDEIDEYTAWRVDFE